MCLRYLCCISIPCPVLTCVLSCAILSVCVCVMRSVCVCVSVCVCFTQVDSITFCIELTVDNKRLKLEQDLSVLCRRLDLLEKRGNLPGCIEWTLRDWSNLPFEVPFFSPVTLRGNQRFVWFFR